VATQVDSRRIPGISLFGARPGAILDVRLAGEAAAAVAGAWSREARRVLRAVGWPEEATAWRVSGSDLSLFFSAPEDALYAATEANELAWACAESVLAGAPPPELDRAVSGIRAAIAAESKPALLALRAEATRRNVALLADDDVVSVGMGAGSLVFPSSAIPDPSEVPWERVHDVPVVLVTGTNGKSTTVRLLGAIVEASGSIPGVSTTDGLAVGGVATDTGDFSGPEGARRILRDPRVEVAALETARGGIQRRGLALRRVDAAAITNIAADHIGEFGVHTLDDIADVKFVVARALSSGAPLVLNGDDPMSRARAAEYSGPVLWFSLAAAEGELELASIPATFGGAARHNVANAFCATRLAQALRIPAEAIERGLRGFDGGRLQNPGRANRFELGGATLLVDFAHNPHGMDALVALAKALPASRRAILVGQAGDRDDLALRALARSAWALAPDRVILKEMAAYRRGRAPGEVPRILEGELLAGGAPAAQIVHAESEIEGVRDALRWARPGDLLVLPTHAARDEVLALIETLARSDWRAGDPLP
jgi:UDP-N-acetylmuramyl tripeptide synthase